MTSNEVDGKTTSERKRLFQPKSQKRTVDKASLPKWFEDSRNMHDHQAKYLGKIYQMREKLIHDEKKLLEHSLTRMDRQKYLTNRPLQGRPRAFTSPSLLDDVKGILISRRSDVKTHTTSSVASVDDLKKSTGLRGKRLCKDTTSFYHQSIDVSDISDMVDPNMNHVVSSAIDDDDVLIKMTKCQKSGCHCVIPCQTCREEPPMYDVSFEKKDRKEFCTLKTEEKPKKISRRKESQRNQVDTLRETSIKDEVPAEKPKSKKETFSRLPKLSNIPRRKRYETKSGKPSKLTKRHSLEQTTVKDISMAGKQMFMHEQANKSDKEVFFSKLSALDIEAAKGNSPTSISPRSISPYSISGASGSPTSPQEFKFPDPAEKPLPKVSINLPPVPLNTPHTTSPHISLSASTSEFNDDHAPVIVFRPATPYIERTENTVKPQSKGWSLWKAVKQTEIRRMELKKLIEDIKEFNTNNTSIEQRLNEVSTS